MKTLQLKGHKDRIWQLSWHPNGNILASCGSDKCANIWRWNGNTYELTQSLDDCHTKTIRAISFSKDGKYLATGGFDSIVCVWILDGEKYKLIQKLEGHESEIKGIGWSENSKYLASCSKDKTVWIWELDDIEFSCNCILQAHDQDVKCIKWLNNILYSGSYDNTVVQYILGEDEEWQEQQILNDHQSTIWCIDVFQNLLITTSADCTARLYIKDKEKYKFIQVFQGYHNEPIYSGTFSYDGKYIALGSGDNKISIFKYSEKDEFGYPKYTLDQIFDAFEYDVNCVQFNPKSYQLASCSDDEIIKIFDFLM